MFWALLLILVIGSFSSLTAFVLPKLFLQNRCAVVPKDRFVKKCDEDGSESLVYEPAPKLRKYITRYALSVRDGKKVLVLRLEESLRYIDYDVVAYNEKGEVRQMLNVKDAVSRKGYSRPIELDDETAYVTLAINVADNETLDGNVLGRVSGAKILLFALLSAIAVVLAVIGIKVCCSYMLGGIFSESLLLDGDSLMATLIVGALVVALYVIITVIAVNSRNKRGKKTKEKK